MSIPHAIPGTDSLIHFIRRGAHWQTARTRSAPGSNLAETLIYHSPDNGDQVTSRPDSRAVRDGALSGAREMRTSSIS